jgi:hypothetical protein
LLIILDEKVIRLGGKEGKNEPTGIVEQLEWKVFCYNFFKGRTK